MKIKTIYPLLFCFLFIAIVSSNAIAQSAKATLSGAVIDPIKAPIPYVRVALVNRKGDFFRGASDNDGKFRIEAPAGVYLLMAKCFVANCWGFQPFELENFSLSGGENKTFDIILKPLPAVNHPTIVPDNGNVIKTAVTGYVYDGHGALIAAAAVTFTDGKGQSQTVKTDEEGKFSFKLKTSGDYSNSTDNRFSVKVQMPGFETFILDNYLVPPVGEGREIRLDVTLKVRVIVDTVDLSPDPSAKKP